MSEKFNVADIFGENVFNDTVMKERLPKNVYKNLKLAMTGVQELSLNRCRCDCKCNERTGRLKRCYTLYTLVPAIDRNNC